MTDHGRGPAGISPEDFFDKHATDGGEHAYPTPRLVALGTSIRGTTGDTLAYVWRTADNLWTAQPYDGARRPSKASGGHATKAAALAAVGVSVDENTGKGRRLVGVTP